MDNLTHSLFGLTLACTPLRRAGRGTTVALLLASNLPDIDIVTSAVGTAGYLHWHRGPTHGPLGVVGFGLTAAAIASFTGRWRTRQDDHTASLSRLWLVSMVGVLCHVLMDLPTSYGTRALSPFSWTWFTTDWMPIIDVYLLAILAGGLLLGQRRSPDREQMRSRNAAIAIFLMLANYGVRAIAHHQALIDVPGVFGAQLPDRCDDTVATGAWLDWWPHPSPRSPPEPGCLLGVAALPSFTSPFRWRLIAHLSNAYETRDVDLLDRSRPAASSPRTDMRYPNLWTPAVVQAARSPIAQVFLGFSRFPVTRSSLDTQGNATVSWTDMRFAVNPLGDQGRGLFRATIRVTPDGSILEAHLGS